MMGILFKRWTKTGGTLFPPSAPRACTDSLRANFSLGANGGAASSNNAPSIRDKNAAADGTRTARRGGKCIERLLLRTHRQPIDEAAFRRELTDIRDAGCSTIAPASKKNARL